jgi:hypothetical protein
MGVFFEESIDELVEALDSNYLGWSVPLPVIMEIWATSIRTRIKNSFAAITKLLNILRNFF